MAQRKYTSIRQLQMDLGKIVADVVLNEVRDEIVEVWLMHQAELVYEQYTPSWYQRRLDEGGLADPSNIETYIRGAVTKELQISLENVTRGSSDATVLINRLIEGSSGYAGDPAMGMPPRPYTEPTIAYLKANPGHINDAIRKGFARHGIKIRVQ